MENNKRKTGAELIAEERQRQIEVEKYGPEHDSGHDSDALARAACAYCLSALGYRESGASMWPWRLHEFKPRTTRENLIRAGALAAAALDRLNAEELDRDINDERLNRQQTFKNGPGGV